MTKLSSGLILRKGKERNLFSQFASLIATPSASAFYMPAGARLVFKAVVASAVGEVLATLGTRFKTIVTSKGLAINEYQYSDRIDADTYVSLTALADVYIQDTHGKLYKIGSNTSAWQPTAIFSAELGGWYQFQLPQSGKLFQDFGGVTAISAVSQALGLALDNNTTVGAEVLTNFDFSGGATGWTVGGSDATHIVTFAGGTARFQSDTTTPILTLSQSNKLVVGSWYQLQIVVSSYTSGACKLDVANGTLPISSAGTFTYYFQAQSINFSITRNSTSVDMTFDSVSVKAISRPPLFQHAPTARPLMNGVNQTIGLSASTSERIIYDFVDDALLWGGATGTYWIHYGDISSNQYLKTILTNSQPIPIAECFGMVIINRALTLLEQANLNSYWEQFRVGLPKGLWLLEVAGGVIGAPGDTAFPSRFYTYSNLETLTVGVNAPIGLEDWYNAGVEITVADREMVLIKSSEPSTLDIINLQGFASRGSISNRIGAGRGTTDVAVVGIGLTGNVPDMISESVHYMSCYNSQLTGTFDIDKFPLSTALIIFPNNKFTGAIPDVANRPLLGWYDLSYNQLTDFSGSFGPGITRLYFNNNLLTVTAVNNILRAAVLGGGVNNVPPGQTYSLNIGGAGNAVPTGQGLTDKATLISRGWSVVTN